jgi:hypothetical protein
MKMKEFKGKIEAIKCEEVEEIRRNMKKEKEQ